MRSILESKGFWLRKIKIEYMEYCFNKIENIDTSGEKIKDHKQAWQ